MNTPAINIDDAWNALTLEPLQPGDFRYVDCSSARGINVVQQLYKCLEWHSKSNKYLHLLFTGYRGDGKTTELHRFIDKIQNNYRPLYFNAENEFDLQDFKFSDFLLGLSSVVFERMDEQGFCISKNLLEKIADWFAEIVVNVELKSIAELKSEAGIGIPNWFRFITGKLIGTLKVGGEKRTTIREKTNTNIHMLIDYVNKLLDEAVTLSKESDNKELIIIFDNLDRLNLELASKLFYNNGKNLCSLNCHFIYVVPIALFYQPGASKLDFQNKITVQMIPVCDKENHFHYDNIEHLKRVLKSRFVPGRIFTDPDKIMEKFILASGGHLRDLVRLIQDACLDTAEQVDKKINEKIALRAINRTCESYLNTVNDDDFAYLIDTYKTKDAGNNKRKQDLIFENVILKYHDEYGNTWEDVHPTIVQGNKFQKLLRKTNANG